MKESLTALGAALIGALLLWIAHKTSPLEDEHVVALVAAVIAFVIAGANAIAGITS